jgi:hypothetical protein
MIPVDIICQHCGWQNEPTARMCGGCGKPLRATDPGATSLATPSQEPAGWARALPGTSPIAHDAPTMVSISPDTPVLGGPPAYTPADASAAPAARWPGLGAQPRKAPAGSGGAQAPWWRIPLIAGIVLVVLVVGFLGAWAVAIRPSLHSDLDTQLRTALDSSIYQVFQGSVPKGEKAISAAFINQVVAADLPTDSPVSNVSVAFANNQAIITYSFWGGSGAVSTNLAALNGRVVASGTSVECPLCFIESGDEMEATFNDALKQIPARTTITQIRTSNDTLYVTVG